MTLTFRILFKNLVFLILAITPAGFAMAETDFVSDRVTYDTNTERVYVEGNVEIKNEQGYFYLERLIYHVDNGRIEIEGHVRGVLTSGEVIESDYALLDQKSKLMILKSARIFLENKLQLAASYVEDDPEKTYGENVIASTCRVCNADQTPIWQIKSEQVIREKNTQKIYFHNASLELFGIPIAAVPNLRIPSPDAVRMSGFLSPEFIFSDLYLTGIRIPYYHVFSDHADLKLTTYLTSGGIANLEMLYRHELKGVSILADGAFSANDGSGNQGRYYFHPYFDIEPLPGWNLQGQYMWASDYNFAPEFSYTNPNRNFIELTKFSNNQNILIELVDYRPLSEAESTYDNAKVIPHVSYENISQPGTGTLLINDFDIDYLEREDILDYRRISYATEIDHHFQNTGIVNLDAAAGLRMQAYDIDNYVDNVHGDAFRSSPFIALDASTPFSRSGQGYYDLLTPRAQIVYSENIVDGVEIPNTDAQFVEHDNVSLFALNHFSGKDRLEDGLRLSLGTTYVRYFDNGTHWDIGLGKVFRFNDSDYSDDRFFVQSGGEWVGYANYVDNIGTSLYARVAINNNKKLDRTEFGVAGDYEKLDYSLDFVKLAAEPEIGFLAPRSEVNASASWQFSPHWLAESSISYDIESQASNDASLSLTYGNECIEAEVGFTRDYNRGEGIDPETRLELSVILIGLGDTPKRDWPRRVCGIK